MSDSVPASPSASASGSALGQTVDDEVEEIAARAPCSALTGCGSPRPSFVKAQMSFSRVVSSTLFTATSVRSAARDRSTAATARVLLGDAGRDVDDQHDHVGRVDGELGLVAHERGERRAIHR